jgi:hypothetical protein
LTLVLEGTTSNRGALGARVVWSAGGARHTAEVRTAFSYLSASGLALSLSLGSAASATDLEVHWPSGAVAKAASLDGEHVWRWKEGAVPVKGPPLNAR